MLAVYLLYSVVSRLAIIWLYSGGGDNDWSSPVENTNHVNVPVFWCSDETTLHTQSSLGSSPPLLPCLHWSLVTGQGPADAGDTVAVVACGQCDGSTLATVWSGAHWAARLVLSAAVLCRVQPPPSSLSWGAAHILTLTQIIFQHCATPRTHTQQPPSRAATGTVGIRMEAWKWHGGQLTWLIWTNFGYNSSYRFPSQESEYYENIFFYLFLNLTFMICSTVSYWQQLYSGWRKVLSAIHCIHSPTPGCLNLSVYKSCYREGIIVTGTTLFNTHKYI